MAHDKRLCRRPVRATDGRAGNYFSDRAYAKARRRRAAQRKGRRAARRP